MIDQDAPPLSSTEIRARLQSRIGKTRRFFPTHLAIETINACNADCVMCPYSSMTRKKGIMSMEDHERLLQRVRDWGAPIREISHAGMGDPLLDKRLEEKIIREKEVFPDAAIYVYTNGGLLGPERAERLLRSGVSLISFSINGFRKDTYERVMRIPRDATYRNVEALIERRNALASPVRIQASLVKTALCSLEEVEEWRAYWADRVESLVLPAWISWGDFFDKEDRQNTDTLSRRLAEQVPCPYIWKTLMVDQSGIVKMCCEDYDTSLPQGNALTDPLDDIFNSPVMQRQRSDQLRGDFDTPAMCRNCVETGAAARDFWALARLAPRDPVGPP